MSRQNQKHFRTTLPDYSTHQPLNAASHDFQHLNLVWELLLTLFKYKSFFGFFYNFLAKLLLLQVLFCLVHGSRVQEDCFVLLMLLVVMCIVTFVVGLIKPILHSCPPLPALPDFRKFSEINLNSFIRGTTTPPIIQHITITNV